MSGRAATVRPGTPEEVLINANRQIRQLLEVIDETPGWDWKRTQNNRYMVLPPHGSPLFLPTNPSEYRALPNALAPLRRAGLDV